MRRALLVLTLLAAGLGALERSSPEGEASGPVDRRPSTLRPLVVFNMRGRRDPFATTTLWDPAGAGPVSISDLQLKGVIQVGGQMTALFVDSSDRASFTLRGSRLFGANDKPLAGVSGRFTGPKEVRLQQGELSLNFSALRAPKRKI
jgi:hypothetical protein